jgi:cob(I)alamin adenosyltransferase
MNEKGLVHIYTGNGKGKTTAAIGLACRAAGSGKKVMIVQFLKGSSTSELVSLKALGVKVVRGDVKKFISNMSEQEINDCKSRQHECFKIACDDMGKFDLVVLDEIIVAVSHKMIELNSLIEMINNKPESTELVLTGRGAPEALVDLADYVSDIKCIKHPFTKGIKARKGIEY